MKDESDNEGTPKRLKETYRLLVFLLAVATQGGALQPSGRSLRLEKSGPSAIGRQPSWQQECPPEARRAGPAPHSTDMSVSRKLTEAMVLNLKKSSKA
jgi:hypothetical protein